MKQKYKRNYTEIEKLLALQRLLSVNVVRVNIVKKKQTKLSRFKDYLRRIYNLYIKKL